METVGGMNVLTNMRSLGYWRHFVVTVLILSARTICSLIKCSILLRGVGNLKIGGVGWLGTIVIYV